MLLNIDLGELPDEPEELYRAAHVANVACGGHAGGRASMERAVACCRRHGVKLAAHPSYPDRAGFGRVAMTMTEGALRATLREQCEALQAIAREQGAVVIALKAHGALYHTASAELATAHALAEVAASLGPGVALVGPPRGALADVARERGTPYLREAFADRATRPDGSLVPRGEPGALLTDPAEAAARAVALAARGDVDTVCVHGDTPGAVAIAAAVRRALDTLAPGRP